MIDMWVCLIVGIVIGLLLLFSNQISKTTIANESDSDEDELIEDFLLMDLLDEEEEDST